LTVKCLLPTFTLNDKLLFAKDSDRKVVMVTRLNELMPLQFKLYISKQTGQNFRTYI